jgi:hypothetical protein
MVMLKNPTCSWNRGTLLLRNKPSAGFYVTPYPRHTMSKIHIIRCVAASLVAVALASCADVRQPVQANAGDGRPLMSLNACDPAEVEFWSMDGLNKPTGTLSRGNTDGLTAQARDKFFGYVNLSFCNVTWTSSNPQVLTVAPQPVESDLYREAIATGVAAGEATVTLTVAHPSNGVRYSRTRKYTVTAPISAFTLGQIIGPNEVLTSGTRSWKATMTSPFSRQFTIAWYRSTDGVNWTKLKGEQVISASVTTTYSEFVGTSDGRFHLKVQVSSTTGQVETRTIIVDGSTALGADLVGPRDIPTPQWVTWSMNAGGGDGVYTYEWWTEDPSTGTRTLVSTSQSWTAYISEEAPWFRLIYIVRSNGGTRQNGGIAEITTPAGI